MSRLTQLRRDATDTEIAALVAQLRALKLTGEQTAELLSAQHDAVADSDWQRISGIALSEIAMQIECECIDFAPEAEEPRGFVGGELSFAERMASMGVRV